MTHEYQGGVEVLAALFLRHLSLVHGVEIETMVFWLDGLEKSTKSVLEATSSQRTVMQTMQVSNAPFRIDCSGGVVLSTPFTIRHRYMGVVGR